MTTEEQRDKMRELLFKLKEKSGIDFCKVIINKVGKADKLIYVKPENYEAVIAECERALDIRSSEAAPNWTASIDAIDQAPLRRDSKLAPEYLQAAIDAIDAADEQSEDKLTIEDALNAVYATWIGLGIAVRQVEVE